jgi:hypothetical protein
MSIQIVVINRCNRVRYFYKLFSVSCVLALLAACGPGLGGTGSGGSDGSASGSVSAAPQDPRDAYLAVEGVWQASEGAVAFSTTHMEIRLSDGQCLVMTDLIFATSDSQGILQVAGQLTGAAAVQIRVELGKEMQSNVVSLQVQNGALQILATLNNAHPVSATGGKLCSP